MGTKGFRPNKSQREFFEEFLRSKEEGIDDVAGRLGVSVDDIERWFENDGFLKWARRRLKSFAVKESFEVWKIALQKAKRGDIQATKLILKLIDENISECEELRYEEILRECGYVEGEDR
ncbi:MAG: hypothetical protein ACPL6C_00020 [bacterium]